MEKLENHNHFSLIVEKNHCKKIYPQLDMHIAFIQHKK